MPKRPPLTHFLCIPLVTSLSKPQLEKALITLTARVAGDGFDPDQINVRIPAKAIRPIGTLHLTLGVMSLDANRLEAAKGFFRSLTITSLLRQASSQVTKAVDALDPDLVVAASNDASKIAAVPPLTMSVTGIHPMHSPTSTTILYAEPVDPSSRLLPFCQALRKVFIESGFMLPDSRPLKLHVTIVNTVYVKGCDKRKRGESYGKDKREGLKFDATEILKEFESHIWMEDVRLDRISICEMGAKKVEVDGTVTEEYLEVESVGLP